MSVPFDLYQNNTNNTIQLFNHHVTRSTVKRYIDIAQNIYQSGYNVPITHSEPIHSNDGRIGIRYECNQQETLLTQYQKFPDRFFKLAKILALQHVRFLNQYGIEGLPKQKSILKNKIRQAGGLTKEDREKVLSLLQSCPDGNKLCHGDFRPELVVLDQNKYFTTCFHDTHNGSPVCDIARTWIILRYAWLNDSKFPKSLVQMYSFLNAKIYKDTCKAELSFSEREFTQWVLVNAAARLSEDTHEHAYIMKLVNRLLKKTFS